MNCASVRELLPAFHDEELTLTEMEGIRSHLAGCSSCQRESNLLTKTWDMLGSLEPIQPSPNFRARFWEKVRQEEARRENLWGWLKWPRLVPAAAGLMAIWFLGITSGLAVFGNRHQHPVTPTEQGVSIFTASYPQNSIEQVFLKGSPNGGRNL